MVKEPYSKRDTGTRIKWRPDLEVFTDIDIPLEYFQDMLRHQSVVNAGVRFILKDQVGKGFETYEYYYEKGIEDYIAERVGNDALTGIQSWKMSRNAVTVRISAPTGSSPTWSLPSPTRCSSRNSITTQAILRTAARLRKPQERLSSRR